MSDRISSREVVADAAKLIARRKCYSAVAFFFLLAVMAPIEWMVTLEDIPQVVPGGWWTVVALMLLGTAPQAAIFNYFITASREGKPPALPERFLVKIGKVLLREVQVLAVVSIPGSCVLAVLLPVLAALYPGAMENPTDPGYLRAVQGVLVAVGIFGFCWPALRLGAGMAGAAVGEEVSFKDSWRMTRGYSFALLLSLIPMILIPLATSWALTPWGSPHDLFSPEMLAQSVIAASLYLFTFVVFSVWYVRLGERFAAMSPAAVAPGGEKISPMAVVRDALAVSWARKWTLVGVSVLGAMPGLFLLGMRVAYPGHAIAWNVVLFLCAVVLGVFVHTLLNHTAIAEMRGKDDFFPEEMLLTMLRVFGRGLIIYVSAFLVILMGIAPLAAFIFVSGDQQMSFPVLIFTLLPAFVGWVAALVIILRLSIMIPGAAAGRVLSMKEAFAMTGGHAWRMAGSLLLVLIPVIALLTLISAVFGSPADQNFLVGPSFIPFLSAELLTAVVSIVAFVAVAVWYERLRLRQEASAPVAGETGP